MGAEPLVPEPPAAEPLTPVGRALAAQAIPRREFRHPGPVTSLEQAAEEYALVLVAGPQQVDWKALRRHMGQSRLTTASADEVRAVTGYEIGAVSPFGLPRPVRVLLDESVLGEEEVSIGSGERGTTVILRTADLLRALGEVERVSVTNTQ